MKKKIGSNYGILVILLFAVVCALTDYIVIERRIREDSVVTTNYDVTEKSSDVIKSNETIALDDVTKLIDTELYVLNGNWIYFVYLMINVQY